MGLVAIDIEKFGRDDKQKGMTELLLIFERQDQKLLPCAGSTALISHARGSCDADSILDLCTSPSRDKSCLKHMPFFNFVPS